VVGWETEEGANEAGHQAGFLLGHLLAESWKKYEDRVSMKVWKGMDRPRYALSCVLQSPYSNRDSGV
jgi:hypothetical protein